jgi:hypothetical protein
LGAWHINIFIVYEDKKELKKKMTKKNPKKETFEKERSDESSPSKKDPICARTESLINNYYY